MDNALDLHSGRLGSSPIGATNGDIAGRSMHLAVNQEIKVRFFLSPQILGS